MSIEDTENRSDDGDRRADVTPSSDMSLLETPEQYGQRVAREVLEKSFKPNKAEKDLR